VQSGVALLVIECSHFLYACLKLFKQRRKIALLFFEMRRYTAMSRLMLKSAKRASLIENLRSLRGLGKMRVR
jgi:hypothetical protein